jgi:RimJ/RimL family protein N-acetyltransferase
MMIKLVEINENNWTDILKLELHDHQKKFVAAPIGILARGYVYRNLRAQVYLIQNDEQTIGLTLLKDLDEYPACYELQQFLISKEHQSKGYAYQALRIIIDLCCTERKYSRIDICVCNDDVPAIKLYEKTGFVDTGYIDEGTPDSLNLTYMII